MKLSIVLTVYNKESYLHRIFAALLSQEGVNAEDYEVLVVNDGSTDRSLAICEEYAKNHSRVRIITQTNQGLSMARNNGVDAANGEYVWFVDADDCISNQSIRLICEAIAETPDVIPIYGETEGIERVRNQVSPEAKTGKDILLQGRWEQCGVFNVLHKVFLTKNGLRFMPGIYHEDAEFTPRMLYAAEKVKVVPEVLYTVYRESGSIMTTPRAKRAFDCLTVAESLSRFVLDRREENTDIGKVIDGSAALLINNGLAVIVQNKNEDQKQLNEAFFKKKDLLLRSMSNAPQWKYRLEASLLKVFPKNCVEIYKLMKKTWIKHIVRQALCRY